MFAETAKMYACLYFDLDKSVTEEQVQVKSRQCKARNDFDVDWCNRRARKERLRSTILKVGDKGEHKLPS